MSWTVDVGYVRDWLLALDERTYDQVLSALKLLEIHGPQLGRPCADTISGSSIKNLKELRPGSAGDSEIRILFVFDPRRHAVMLVGGNKKGGWKRWYQKNIKQAERVYKTHLNQLKGAAEHGNDA